MGLPLGGGIGGIVLLLVVSALTGTNPLDLINSSAPQEQTWRELFQGRGEAYAPPILVLFDGATQSACGVGRQEMGPFYCPADQKVYLDLSLLPRARRALWRARRLRQGLRRRARSRTPPPTAPRRSACAG